jgi:hypothetical protein
MRRRNGLLVLACMLCLLAVPAWAQEGQEAAAPEPQMDPAMMEAWMKAMTPGEPHEHLAEMAGSYKIEIKSWMEPGGEPAVMEGTALRKMTMGGRHLEETVESDFMGQPFEGVGMTGYDNAAGEYWSTWVDNMSTGVMLVTGNWDESQHAMVMEGDFTDPMTGELQHHKIVSKALEGGGERSEFFHVKDGEMVKMMEITYTPK